MALLQCKHCGGNTEIPKGVTYGVCRYCKADITFPKQTTDQKMQLFQRAEQLWRAQRFDKAASAFEEVVRVAPDDADAYWMLVLSEKSFNQL